MQLRVDENQIRSRWYSQSLKYTLFQGKSKRGSGQVIFALSFLRDGRFLWTHSWHNCIYCTHSQTHITQLQSHSSLQLTSADTHTLPFARHVEGEHLYCSTHRFYTYVYLSSEETFPLLLVSVNKYMLCTRYPLLCVYYLLILYDGSKRKNWDGSVGPGGTFLHLLHII